MFLSILKGLLVAIAGVLLLLFPTESLYTVLIYLGIAMVCYGAVTIIAFFVSRSKAETEQSEKSKNQGKIISLVTGILALACGIVVLAKPELVVEFFPRLVSAFVLAAGAACIAKAISKRKESDGWIHMFAIAVATVILGGIILFRPFDEVTIVRILGTVLLYLGAGSAVEA
jgi:uncharacterized membrane protein HdeD (DUF308 family)